MPNRFVAYVAGAAVSVAVLAAVPSVASAAPDKGCGDFTSQAAAQTYFAAAGGSIVDDVDQLDNNHDGVACEDFPFLEATSVPSPAISAQTYATSAMPGADPSGQPAVTTTAADTTTLGASPAATVTFEQIRAEIAALNCTDYNTKLGHIEDGISALASQDETTLTELGALRDAEDAKNKALNYCIGDLTASSSPAASTAVVSPTRDDGTTAVTSGSQVTDVPTGSAQTGDV